MKKTYIIISLAIASLILLYFTFIYVEEESQENQYESLRILPVQIGKQKIYLKIAIWGISADKEAIIISRDSSQSVNVNKDIIFEGIRNYNYFYLKQDTLNLILDMMKLKSENDSFKNLIKIDTIRNSKISDLYNKNLMIDDSIKISKF